MNNFIKIHIPLTQNALQPDTSVIKIKGGHKLDYPLKNTEF